MSLRMRSASLTMRRIAGVSPYRDASDVTHRRRPPINSCSSASSVWCSTSDLLGLKGVLDHSTTTDASHIMEIGRETGHVRTRMGIMADQAGSPTARGRAARTAPARQPGGAADGVGRVVGEARRRRGLRGADRRQPPGRRLDRQGRQRGHDIRRAPHPRRPDHRRGRRPGLGRHRVRLRRGAGAPHRRSARRRGGRPQHRGHRARRGRPAAVVRPSTPSSSGRFGPPPTPPACMWCSTRAPTCSCARTATSPTASTGRWRG